MSVTISPQIHLQFFTASGVVASGYQLFTYQAGTSIKQATWTDSTQSTQNANPLQLDSQGRAYLWTDPTLVYKYVLALPTDTDPPQSPVETVDNVQSPINLSNITQALIGTTLYPRTAAEIAAGVTPTNYAYAPLDTRRYGTKGDGTTDDTAAIQAASNVAKQLTGGGVVMLLGTAGNSFKVTAAITLAAGVEVRGQGEQVTTVTQATANADCFQGTNASFAKISSLSISMPDTGAGVAIHWICSGTHDFYYPRVDSVQILQVAGSGVGIWADNQSNTNTIYWPDIQRTVIQGGAANDYQSKIGVQWGGAGSVIVVGPTMRAVRAFRVQKGFYGYNCDTVRGSDCSLDDCQGGSGIGVHLHNAGFCRFQGLRMEPMTFDTFIQCDSGASDNRFDVVDFGNIPSAKVVDNGTNNEFWGSDGSGGFINTIKLPVNISDVNSITVGPGQTPAGTPLTLYHATTATVNPGAIAAGAAVDTAVSIPGVIGTDKAIANPPAGLDAGLMCSTLIGTGLVYIRLANITGSPVTPVSQVWNIAVLR